MCHSVQSLLVIIWCKSLHFNDMTYIQNDELFVPELAKHFRSREQNIHRENFRSSGTFIRSLELSLLSCDCSMELSPNYTGAKVLGTFASKERRKFQGANVPSSMERKFFLWTFRYWERNVQIHK